MIYDLIEDLKAGWIDSLIVQNPFKMGYESTKAVALKAAIAAMRAFLIKGLPCASGGHTLAVITLGGTT